MVECNSHETRNIYPNLNDQQQFGFNKINEIKDYFCWKLISKRLSKYIACCDYFDESLIVLPVTTVVFLLPHLQPLLEHQ